jgi:hypothetical protein
MQFSTDLLIFILYNPASSAACTVVHPSVKNHSISITCDRQRQIGSIAYYY